MKDKKELLNELIDKIKFSQDKAGMDVPYIDTESGEIPEGMSEDVVDEARLKQDDKFWDIMAKAQADKAITAEKSGDEDEVQKFLRRLEAIKRLRK